MGTWVRTLDGGNGYFLDFLVKEAITAGQVLVREDTATQPGEVEDPSTTAAPDFIGCASSAATYNAAPTAEPNRITRENLVRVIVNPLSIWRFPISGGATAGTALQPASASPANILAQDTASTTVVADTAVGTVNMEGGLIKGRTGANVGAIRKIAAHTDNVSETVTMAFVNSIAVGDTLIRVPYSRRGVNMQLTSNFVEADGIIAVGTGAAFAIVNVIIDEAQGIAWVDVVSRDHFYSPESA